MSTINPAYLSTQRVWLYHDDAYTLLPQRADKCVDIVLTDPLYDMSQKDKLFCHEHFCRLARKAVIVFMPPENPWITPADQYLFWIKPISTKNTSKRYSRFVEQIFVYQMEEYTWNAKRHWSQYTNVFTDLVDDSTLHPFRKPPSLLERLILNHTNENDLVFDPFMGSGSTGEAAVRLNRMYAGIEINSETYKLAKSRILSRSNT